jgi:hypothetical protein
MRTPLTVKVASLLVLFGVLLLSPTSAWADNVLIINGASGTSEPGTTAAITTNLNTLQLAVGNTTTIVSDVPASFAGFNQVWDIRFSNNQPLTSGDISQYVSFMQGGGRMFVMGENQNFPARNDSVLALISAAGGGSLTFVIPSSTQTVLPPFTGPNPIPGNTINYSAPGGVTSPGTGQFMTVDGAGRGTGIAFGPGTLSNAPAGTLTVVFDVNFMQGDVNNPNLPNIQFLRNLIGFVQEPTPAPIPEPTTMLLLGTGLAGVGAAVRKRRSAKKGEES